VPVHDIHVDQIGAAALGSSDLFTQRREIGCEDGWSDEDAGAGVQRLTSMEIGSPGAI
jgi:hypothetical protein